MGKYDTIQIAGGDTAMPLSLGKRIRFISQACDLSKVRLLDCGCGAGQYVFALVSHYGTDAWGIEYSEAKVRKAKENLLHAARIKRGDLQAIDEPDSTFDVAILNEVLEHIPDDTKALQEVHRVLKPNGRVIVFSPNRLFPFETHGVRVRGTKIRLAPSVPLIPYVPLPVGRLFLDYWARNYWPAELRALVHAAGFTIETTGYIWQTFENISGSQPAFIKKSRKFFRRVAEFCENSSLLCRFGVSQVIVARKPPGTLSGPVSDEPV